jgi:hypothetical protein
MMFRTIQTLAAAALVACPAASNASDIRRVVTGLDADNKAVGDVRQPPAAASRSLWSAID